METYKTHILPRQTGILVGILVTAMLFMGLPLLTKLQPALKKVRQSGRVMISNTKPPPPPEPEKEKLEQKKPKENKAKKTTQQKLTATPKIKVPSFSMPGAAISGTIQISGLADKSFDIDASLFATAFNLNEVDQKPSVLRKFDPVYPFLAKRKNIEGKVWVRCVVDKDGYPQEPEVFRAEPEGQGFEENALKAIVRWRFQPAIVDGEPVDCIVVQPITFNLR